MSFDQRHRWIIKRITDTFAIEKVSIVEQCLSQNLENVNEFFKPDGPLRILFAFQSPPEESAPIIGTEVSSGGENSDEDEDADRAAAHGPLLNLVDPERNQTNLFARNGRLIYFVRITPKVVNPASVDVDIAYGELLKDTITNMDTMLCQMYFPFLLEQESWGEAEEVDVKNFLHTAYKFVDLVSEAAASVENGVNLRSVDPTKTLSEKPSMLELGNAARDMEMVTHYEATIEDWSRSIENTLMEGKQVVSGDDVGPNSELEFWKLRLSVFTNITEQLKDPQKKNVLAVLNHAKSKVVLKRWKALDNSITDAANEAKDNVKYLATLQAHTEPLYTGTPVTIIDSLPAMMNNIKMMHTIARYYNTTDRMTQLFAKITNQMIKTCKQFLKKPGNLWQQDPEALILNISTCLDLNEAYQEQYRMTKDKMMINPAGRRFDFSEMHIFGKFDLFCNRLTKLNDLFQTVHQFTQLAAHKIEGMEDICETFLWLTEELKKKPYDLLDAEKNQFDRDYLEFNTQISELERALQSFVNGSFENIPSTTMALKLLRKFQSILHREALKADLNTKYQVIFHNYGLDLEQVQKLYERHKSAPPMYRNAPPVAGNILWCRQLLRRIEEPMRRFQANKALMSTKESKKIIKTYNRVAKALTEFETLWHYAWCKSIELAKAGLLATLVVRPKAKYYINFDKEIFQLIRETRCLQRMNIEVPEGAKMVVLIEEKLKGYYDSISFVLKEYQRVIGKVLSVVMPLMRPHIEDLEKKIRPGTKTLTWTSMNIDVYLKKIHAALIRLEDLIVKINDIVENRIMKNLKNVSKMLLVDLPLSKSFTLEQFVTTQENHIRDIGNNLEGKNTEVEQAVLDLINLIESYPLEAGQEVPEEAKVNLRTHYLKLMYQAVLNAVNHSLFALKGRIGNRRADDSVDIHAQAQPFFTVSVELGSPDVSMNPTPEDVQFAVNRSAIAVLRTCRRIEIWKSHRTEDGPTSFFEEIAKDKEIVKVVLLLTGGIEGLKNQVQDYLQQFRQYDYLWKEDKVKEYAEFLSTDPTVEEFELKLKFYMGLEQNIGAIPDSHNIGALCLQTGPLKASLRSEATAWKTQYAKNLHHKSKDQLEALMDYMKDTGFKLNRKITDLEDVRITMEILKEIREREAEIDLQFNPVEETYSLLLKYDVKVTKEELDHVNELRYSWRKLRKLATGVNDNLIGLQAGFKKDLITSVRAFVLDVNSFVKDYRANGPKVPGIAPAEAVERLNKFKRLYEERERKWDIYSAGEDLFGLPKTQFQDLESIRKELMLMSKLYSLYMNVLSTMKAYRAIAWSEVTSNIESMSANVGDLAAQCKKMPKDLQQWEAYVEMKEMVEDFLETLPLLQALSHQSMRPRHWSNVSELTGVTLDVHSDSFHLSDILAAGLINFKEDIEDIANSAVKEMGIEDKLAAINDEWADEVLTFSNFKNRGPVVLKGQETNEIIEKLEDSQMSLGSMMSSRYIGPFKEEVFLWLTKLSTVSEVIEQWIVVQSMWIYLEAVFSSGDIAKQLPQEAKRFSQVDKSWMKIMNTAFEKRKVIAFCYGNDLLKNLLPHLTEQLEICQKSLSGYLETKRNLFPRFYFVSDPVLLEILSQGSDPHAIQAHLQSCFDSIVSLTFDKVKKTDIKEMHSMEGETVPMVNVFPAQGNIEDWLSRLEFEMMATMKEVVRSAAGDCMDMPLDEFVNRYPAQVALLGIQFIWTHECQEALNRSKSEKKILSDTLKRQGALLSELTTMTMQDLSNLERTKIEAMITIQVHQRDVFEELVKKKVKDASDFEWQKQTRFYWKHDKDDCFISVADNNFYYCYEYLGCKERLVITPLTDRCYISLTQALGMFYGGAPAGPAGTGKTETVKDLGRALGKYVVVFNCSDQMDYKALGKIFKGVCQSGAWGDFDEFNRIELEVLSVAAQQIQSILSAMREHLSTFVFTDGQNVKCSPEAAVFITMNPGYAGRQELPENLKACFRGVTMMVPDRQIIIKVKLAAAGYQEAPSLALKFHVLYRLCEEQLSKQPHYDFGLRNILSVLRTAGTTKRANPERPENVLLMRTLRDMNLSKFVAEDVPLFLSLVNDVFPGVTVEKAHYPSIENAIQSKITDAGLVNHAPWVEKIIQLYEMSLVRHGLMIVGPASCGKSSCIDILLKALTDTGTQHKETRMNPKAITASQMFGALDSISNDWTDGIFSAIWRKANKGKSSHNLWIICDGPVDAIWIENLNSVLDDNKLLTLANGDRIPMIPTVKLTFEVENLNNASPATVSRAGIIYISGSVLGWNPLTTAWLKQRRSDSQAAHLEKFITRYVPAALKFVETNCISAMEVTDVNLVASLLALLAGFLTKVEEQEVQSNLDEVVLERYFLFALVWSIGGVLEPEERLKLHKHLADAASSIAFPPEINGSTIYDYYVDIESGEWYNWTEKMVTPTLTEKDSFSSLLVPTVDSTRLEFIMTTAWERQRPVLLIGSSGSSKTSIVLQFLSRLDPEKMLNKTISFSSATTPDILHHTIDSIVEKRTGRTFGPAGGKKMTVFIDDMNMPEINEWGDQITSEASRQLIEQRGFYNLEKPGEWKDIIDLNFVGAMNHPGGGRNDIPGRLKRHFSVLNVPLPSNSSIDHIYATILKTRYNTNNFTEDVLHTVSKLTDATISLWQRVKTKMLPTPKNFHYIFSMRDISRVFQGFLVAPNSVVQSSRDVISLWRHECSRVFGDKLTSNPDKQWVATTLDALTMETFPEVHERLPDPFYVDFMRDAVIDEETGEEVEAAEKVYEPVEDLNVVRTRLEFFLGEYNEANRVKQLDLVLFEDAICHLVRISRIVTMPRGNALLVGVGGSGKQSLSRLASFIAGQHTFQITITKSYNEQNLFDDIRALYKIAGVQNKPVTFIFTDSEIKKESFLEYINNVLLSGEIPGLFPKDELDMIVADCRDACREARPHVDDTYENIHRYFVDTVRDNLHIVLCFSPVGEKFRLRAQKFPGLISGCTINWFLPWPNDALLSVAQHYISQYDVEWSDELKSKMVVHMSTVHRTVGEATDSYFQKFRRRVHLTPKSYLSFINAYKELYVQKSNEVDHLARRINGGLEKLLGAADDVAQMKIDLQQKEISLADAQKKSSALLIDITSSTAIAEKKKGEVAVMTEELTKQAAQIASEKAEAEQDLAAAKPALIAAENALKLITAKDLNNLKALRNPPDLIKRIFDGVILLRHGAMKKPKMVEVKGKKQFEDSYDTATKFMSNPRFLESLLNFERDNINDETCELLDPYTDAEDWNYESAKKSSGNVAGLLTWVSAMSTYHRLAKVVQPKIEALQVAESRLKSANAKLQASAAELSEITSQLDSLQESFDEAMAEKQRLQEDAEATKRKMDAANALIHGLSGEKQRWTEQSKEFAARMQRLIGDVSLACGFTSYSGPFNQEFREVIQQRLAKDLSERYIPLSKDLNLTSFLADDHEIGEWNLQGLPTDELSTQNGILVTRATKFPLMIDPQGQGYEWIKKREEVNGLKITNLNDRNFRPFLEDCMAFGKPLLIENVEEELDPILDPVLDKLIQKAGRSLKITLTDGKECEYSEDFKLFMVTKLANPMYSPELFAKVNVIDFTVTRKGLESQLLGRVVQLEKYELEEQRQKILEDTNMYAKKIKELEDDLLHRLSASDGNLLDDTTLIDVLASTKQTSLEVNEKLVTAKETQARISTAREEYRPVAKRGSIIYFVISDMSNVNSMYQTSLRQFLLIFDNSIENSERERIASKRLQAILEYLTYSTFVYISRGLLEAHKTLFILLLSISIQSAADLITKAEVAMLLKAGAALDINSVKSKPAAWIPDTAWLNLVQLSTVPPFADLLDTFRSHSDEWRAWYDQDAPESAPIPFYEENVITTMKKLLVVRSLREDRSLLAATSYIRETLGQRYTESVPVEIDSLHLEASERTPLVFILTPGADPSELIEGVAKRKKKEIKAISMGQGQEIIARRLLTNAFASGSWVLLQNCHLGLKFLPEVEQTLLEEDDINEDFRLWITSEPHPKFSIGLLQMSVKITNEAPQGIKAGLKRSYTWIDQDMLDSVGRSEWRAMLYCISFLHTIVQERRRFGSLGFNIPYEFNQSDLSASVQFCQNHLNRCDATKTPIQWNTIRYMICDVQYGGRITDDFDRRLFNTYGEGWLGPKMFDQSFQFYPGYRIPTGEVLSKYKKEIEDLPLVDSPEVFGLHQNAEITFRTSSAHEVFRTILDIQPKETGGDGGATREDLVSAQIEDLMGRLPTCEDFERPNVQACLSKMGSLKPLNICLRQEIDRLKKVIVLTGKTMKDLKLAIAGTIILSHDLSVAMDHIFDARVPPKWSKISWASPTLGLWFTGLLNRYEQLSRWLSHGRPEVFWLTGLFNPQGFLTAMRQEVTRKHQKEGWALDDVVVFTEVTKYEKEDIRDAPSEGIYIHGLFLDGAAWDKKNNGKLVDSPPKVLFCALPVLYVSAVLGKESKADQHTYPCPCYRIPKRTDLNYIFTVDVRTEDPPQKWVLRGVALLCSKE